MIRQSVTSSTIESIGYDAKTQTLEIEFKKGSVYQYYGVPESEYAALMGAESHGSYFAHNIKGRYGDTKVS